MNPIQTAIRQASELLKNAYLSAAAAGDLPQAQLSEPQIEIPRDLRNGDYASSFAMQNAKALHLPLLFPQLLMCLCNRTNIRVIRFSICRQFHSIFIPHHQDRSQLLFQSVDHLADC